MEQHTFSPTLVQAYTLYMNVIWNHINKNTWNIDEIRIDYDAA